MINRLLHDLSDDLKYAERMGYDAGLKGPNTTNCHFGLFRSRELARAWERGNKRGLNAKVRGQRQRIEVEGD